MNNKINPQYLKENKQKILKEWLKVQEQSTDIKKYISRQELEDQSQLFLDILLDMMNLGKNYFNSDEYKELKEQIDYISTKMAQMGFSPGETASYILSLKEVMANHIIKQSDDPEVVELMATINKIIDNLTISSFENYIKRREEIISRQNLEIMELSTPVIQIWEGVLVLPIIGTLDSSRTQIAMENLLNSIVNTGSYIAILDISGVSMVDSLVAQHLIKTVSAARLMGAECIISGVRPEIAQTIVHLGIDLREIQTKSNLSAALKMALEILHYKVINENHG
jgi:rsbT co-antagonist protein RsbR